MEKRQIGVGHFQATPRMVEYVNQVLSTGRISYGPFSKKFEEKFSALHDCKYGVLSNSGTSSLQVALQTLKELNGWQDGDEVIVPASTFVATLNIVLHNRMKPVLADVRDGYWDIDPIRISEAITPRTRCIIPVHPFGAPADMAWIDDIARRNRLKIIEDSCESVLATQHDRLVGSFGDIGCFSFYVAHIIVTGVGGMATTNNPDYAVKMRSLVNHGRSNIYVSIDDDDDLTLDRLKEVIGKRFHFESVGHSYRITEFESALGLAQVEDGANEIVFSRRTNAYFLLHRLYRYYDRLQFQIHLPSTFSAHMMFPLCCRFDEKKRLCEFLESYGVETRDALPLTCQPVYKTMNLFNESDYPIAAKLNKQGFYISCHQHLALEDINYMIDVFDSYFKEYPNP